jgi:hypothetical protein
MIYRLELFLIEPAVGPFHDPRPPFFTRPDKYTKFDHRIRGVNATLCLFRMNAVHND